MKILGIESTCDETGAAIVEDGTRLVSNIVASSSKMHEKYGGIVPEVAAREQVKVIVPVISEAVGEMRDEIDAIAVSYGPGLLGSLLVGVEAAKTLSVLWNLPLIKVNHMLGHIFANWIGDGKKPEFPLVALIVSGGHTDLLYMKTAKEYKWLGGTRDDAAGEAFDKIARVLGIKYPGGPEIEKMASDFREKLKIVFPKPLINSNDFDFSFSGLKTFSVNFFKNNSADDKIKKEFAFGVQKSVTDVLVKKTLSAAMKFRVKNVVVGGGVSANNFLRDIMTNVFKENDIEVFFPEKSLSTDNGAMIASAAYFVKDSDDILKVEAEPNLYFD